MALCVNPAGENSDTSSNAADIFSDDPSEGSSDTSTDSEDSDEEDEDEPFPDTRSTPPNTILRRQRALIFIDSNSNDIVPRRKRSWTRWSSTGTSKAHANTGCRFKFDCSAR